MEKIIIAFRVYFKFIHPKLKMAPENGFYLPKAVSQKQAISQAAYKWIKYSGLDPERNKDLISKITSDRKNIKVEQVDPKGNAITNRPPIGKQYSLMPLLDKEHKEHKDNKEQSKKHKEQHKEPRSSKSKTVGSYKENMSCPALKEQVYFLDDYDKRYKGQVVTYYNETTVGVLIKNILYSVPLNKVFDHKPHLVEYKNKSGFKDRRWE